MKSIQINDLDEKEKLAIERLLRVTQELIDLGPHKISLDKMIILFAATLEDGIAEIRADKKSKIV